MSTLTTIETPERSAFTYEIAGLGSRSLAYLIDAMIQLLALIIILTVIALSQIIIPLTWHVAVLMTVAFFAKTWLYMTLFEFAWQGRTPGKLVLGIRVICEGGATAGFIEIAIRNLLRPIDSLPVGYLVGIIAVFLTSKHQRIGDLVAGTIVIRVQNHNQTAQLSNLIAVHETSAAASVRHRLGISSAQAEAFASFLSRQAHFLPPARDALARQLAAPVRLELASRPTLAARIQPQKLSDAGLLQVVLNMYHHPEILDSHPETPPQGDTPGSTTESAGSTEPPAGGPQA